MTFNSIQTPKKKNYKTIFLQIIEKKKPKTNKQFGRRTMQLETKTKYENKNNLKKTRKMFLQVILQSFQVDGRSVRAAP